MYFLLVASCSPSRSQVTTGLGLPKAVQLSVMLPPSLASTYCGGTSMNVGGAKEKIQNTNNNQIWPEVTDSHTTTSAIFCYISKNVSKNDFKENESKLIGLCILLLLNSWWIWSLSWNTGHKLEMPVHLRVTHIHTLFFQQKEASPPTGHVTNKQRIWREPTWTQRTCETSYMQ